MEQPHPQPQPQPGCGGAEAVLDLKPNSSISIAYHHLFGSHHHDDDLVLLELDEKLLPDVLHQRVSFRGHPEEDAVLCTRSKTYAVKFVATSNSVLLIPPSHHFAPPSETSQHCDDKSHDLQRLAPVIKLAPGNMELTEIAPKLDKLKLLLLENPYTSNDEVLEVEDMDKTSSRRSYTWDDLVDRVQASDEELRIGLQAFLAVEIDGYWRIVDDKYMDTVLTMLLYNCVLNDWPLDALREDEVVRVLESDGFLPQLGRHCLYAYGRRVDHFTWKLDEKRICVHFAREILRSGKKKIETFKAEWSQKIPDGMQAALDMLEGEVLTEKLGADTWVRAFPVTSLPLTPADRFSALFRERSKWEWKDLEPYIRDLNVPGLSLEGLLLKYTRRTQPTADSQPVFSAR